MAVVQQGRARLLSGCSGRAKGREELNFSTWDRYTTKDQVKKLKESWEEVAEGEMPPWFYLPIHHDAVLSAEDRLVLRKWALGSQ